jgi:hypothetical protein
MCIRNLNHKWADVLKRPVNIYKTLNLLFMFSRNKGRTYVHLGHSFTLLHLLNCGLFTKAHRYNSDSVSHVFMWQPNYIYLEYKLEY